MNNKIVAIMAFCVFFGVNSMDQGQKRHEVAQQLINLANTHELAFMVDSIDSHSRSGICKKALLLAGDSIAHACIDFLISFCVLSDLYALVRKSAPGSHQLIAAARAILTIRYGNERFDIPWVGRQHELLP